MSKELGTLVVVVLKARNLPDNHFYKQDVYTKVTLQGTTKKTKVDVKGGQHPEWDDEVRFIVSDDSSKSAMTLEISCWSKEPRQDAVVGKGEVDISNTLRTGEFDEWVPLSTDKGQRGEIYLEMTWFAAGPPPALSRRPSKLKPSERLSRPAHTYQSSLAPIPSSPPTTNGRLPARDASYSEHTSPKGALPPLPEEAHVSQPSGALPSILRPGAGRPRPAHSSPPTQPSDSQAQSSQHHRASLSHDQANSLPGLLRAGPPNGRPPSQVVPVADVDIPSLPASSLGHSSPPHTYSPPGYFNPLPAATPQPSHGVQASYTQPLSYQRPSSPYIPHTSPIQRPVSSNAAPTPVPQPTASHHIHSAPQPTYPGPAQATPAQLSLSYAPQQAQPPTHLRHDSQSAPYPAQSPAPNPTPGFTLPLWGNQPTQPPPHPSYNAAPAYPAYGYAQPPPPPHSYMAPPGATRPYPYNYPPPRDLDAEFDRPIDPAKAARYKKPLPLPDDGVPPPGSAAASAPAQSRHSPPRREPSADDRDIALRLQQEEEERQRKQEELDAEFARKLDMELNLAGEESAPTSQPQPQPARQGSESMPGSWYRQRPSG